MFGLGLIKGTIIGIGIGVVTFSNKRDVQNEKNL